MKNNHFAIPAALLVTALLAGSCKKETIKSTLTSPETAIQSAINKPKNECRVTQIFEPLKESLYRYNSLGLVDEWELVDFGVYRIDYDENGIPVKASFYSGTDLLWTIDFFYEKNRIVKEIWFDIPTSQIFDIYLYSYNKKGQMVRGESVNFGYHVDTKYTPEGNVLSWEAIQAGTPFMSGHYTYDQPYKNPRRAAQGIIYDFPYYDGAQTFSKFFYSSAKYVVYDQNGIAQVQYDMDPSKTIWQRGHQNYPLSVSYFDLIRNQTWLPVSTFTYDNCGPGTESSSSQISVLAAKGSAKVNPGSILRPNPLKPLKEQVKELRQRLKKGIN